MHLRIDEDEQAKFSTHTHTHTSFAPESRLDTLSRSFLLKQICEKGKPNIVGRTLMRLTFTRMWNETLQSGVGRDNV